MLSAKNTKWKFMQIICNHVSLRIRKRLFAVQFKSHRSCSWLTILLVLSIVVVSLFYDTLFPFTFPPVSFQAHSKLRDNDFQFHLPLCTYCLPIFYKSNLRMSLGYLQPRVNINLLGFWYSRGGNVLDIGNQTHNGVLLFSIPTIF